MKLFLRVLIGVILLVAAIPTVGIIAVSLWLRYDTSGPDVRKVTRSDSFRQQRAASVAVLDQNMAAFTGTAPHGTRLATEVLDQCGSAAAFFGERPAMTCERHVSVFLAFDGDLAALRRSWNRSLAAVAWEPSEDHPAGAYQQFSYRYADSPSVLLHWSTRGDTLTGPPAGDYTSEVTLEQQPVDMAALYRDAYAHHRYVVELSTSAQYYPRTPAAPRSPAPSPGTTWNGCFNGHHCPGG